ncbi:hypothetical protein SAY87_017685 [Trapa incisa]|uniref:Uncharacterized protein n=1 Tax=Trapa incisa TaxID=236973 RepID=A0AAN7QWB1_9MYRT|nr:hypothetical protein SAY87_017685 [Trapa incisa]
MEGLMHWLTYRPMNKHGSETVITTTEWPRRLLICGHRRDHREVCAQQHIELQIHIPWPSNSHGEREILPTLYTGEASMARGCLRIHTYTPRTDQTGQSKEYAMETFGIRAGDMAASITRRDKMMTGTRRSMGGGGGRGGSTRGSTRMEIVSRASTTADLELIKCSPMSGEGGGGI